MFLTLQFLFWKSIFARYNMTSDRHLTAAASGPRAGIRRTFRRPSGPNRSWYKIICVLDWRRKIIDSKNLPRFRTTKGRTTGYCQISLFSIWIHVCHFACHFALLNLLINFISSLAIWFFLDFIASKSWSNIQVMQLIQASRPRQQEKAEMP